MAKSVRVTISGPKDDRIDAPTVDDLLGQIRDFVEVLRGVENAMERDAAGKLVWRVTDATMNSPISMEFTPYGTGPATAVSARAVLVQKATADGFKALRSGEIRPAYFTDDMLAKARKIHSRVLNGLSDTTINFDPEIEQDAVVIDNVAARELEKAIERAKAVESIPYRELGSIEGFVTKPELDGHSRAILRFKSRVDGTEIKAYADGEAFRQVEALRLSDVWHGARVRVYGLISYKSLGQVEQMNATGIELLDKNDLPGIDDIIDPNFTGGLSTEEFLNNQRGIDG